MKKNMKSIVKLQALWRGNLARKQFHVMKMQQRGGSRYFTADESRETLSKAKFYLEKNVINIFTNQVQLMKVNGEVASEMVSELKSGRTVQATKVNGGTIGKLSNLL